MRTSALAVCTALALLGAAAAARGEDPAPEKVVAAFLDEVRAGKGEAAIDATWDGTAIARAAFAPRWDALPDVERAEIAPLAAALVAHDLLRSLAKATGPGSSKAKPVLGAPKAGGADGEHALVSVGLVAKARGKVVSSATLVFRVANGRIVDYRWDDPKSAFAVEYVPRVTRELWKEGDDPLAFAYAEWGRTAGRAVPPDSALRAVLPPPAPEWATRDLVAVDLPRVPGAAPDVRLDVPEDAPWGPRLLVNVLVHGHAAFRESGRRSPWQDVDLTVDEETFRAARSALIASLKDAVAAAGPRAVDGTSPLGLVVRADRSARWDVAFRVAALGAHPAVAVREVGFVTREGADGRPGIVTFAAPVFRPPDAEEPAAEPLVVRLLRKDVIIPSKAHTKIVVEGGGEFFLPRGTWTGRQVEDEDRAAVFDDVYRSVRDVLRRRASDSGRRGVAVIVSAADGAAVPAGDVVRALQTVRDAGLELVRVGTDAP